MKILTISMFITLLSSSVFAKKFTPESEEQNYKNFLVKIDIASDFIKNKSECYLSIGNVAYRGHFVWVMPTVLCMLDGTSKAGTVDEKSGCALMTLNLKTNKLDGLVKSMKGVKASYNIASKPCKNGGAEELLKMKPIDYSVNSKNARTNADFLKSGNVDMISDKKTELVLLHAENDSFKKMFEK